MYVRVVRRSSFSGDYRDYHVTVNNGRTGRVSLTDRESVLRSPTPVCPPGTVRSGPVFHVVIPLLRVLYNISHTASGSRYTDARPLQVGVVCRCTRSGAKLLITGMSEPATTFVLAALRRHRVSVIIVLKVERGARAHILSFAGTTSRGKVLTGARERARRLRAVHESGTLA